MDLMRTSLLQVLHMEREKRKGGGEERREGPAPTGPTVPPYTATVNASGRLLGRNLPVPINGDSGPRGSVCCVPSALY